MEENYIRLDILEQMCKNKGITLAKLASELNISPATFSRWKTGIVPKISMLVKIAEYFGVTVDSFLDRDYTVSEPDENFIALQRAYNKSNANDRERMLQIIKLTLPDAFEKESSDDTI